MKTLLMHGSLMFVVGLIAVGCGRVSDSPAAGSGNGAATVANSTYRLASEPAGAQDVKLARTSAKDNDEVVVVGRIGGDANPWIDGMAAFTIVDLSLKPCEDGACGNPYCDADDLPTSKAMVKVVDGEGSVVPTESRQLLGVKELQTVVVRGKAKRDEAGNLTILASGIFVRP
ncbi:MAG: hypothetical protein ABFD16_17975 [Thermoguttaceae bacterium]